MLKFATPKGWILVAASALALMAASARAAEPPPAAVALATQILTDVGLKGTIDGIALTMMGELERNVVGMHPELQTPLHETLVALAPEFVNGGASVMVDVASVFASRMSEQEMKDTKTFFESPAGKKYLEAQTPVLQQLNASGAAFRSKLSTEMLTRVREEMKKKGYNL